jgi:acetyl esterase/lipase
MITLWEQAPGLDLTLSPDVPALTLYRVNGAIARAAVIICPGGGYVCRVDREAEPIARWLNALGLHAAVLTYRVHPYHYPYPVLDGKRAVKVLRYHAAALGIIPDQIGILGFSAGGHLASTVATHFDEYESAALDDIDAESCRPDFAILCYPVINLDSALAHRGSAVNLLGEDADPALFTKFSNEKQVTPWTPPCFLWHSAGDTDVPVGNSVRFADALAENGVPFGLHVYPGGQHGWGHGWNGDDRCSWRESCAEWLRLRKILP